MLLTNFKNQVVLMNRDYHLIRGVANKKVLGERDSNKNCYKKKKSAFSACGLNHHVWICHCRRTECQRTVPVSRWAVHQSHYGLSWLGGLLQQCAERCSSQCLAVFKDNSRKKVNLEQLRRPFSGTWEVPLSPLPKENMYYNVWLCVLVLNLFIDSINTPDFIISQ